MSDFGIQIQGFVVKPADEIKFEVEALMQSIFGNTIDLSPSTKFGQWVAAQVSREVDLWQLAQALYTARDPDGAEGNGLVELCAITGTVPVAPSPSSVLLTLTGTNGTSVSAGKVVAVAVTGVQFITQSTVVLATATSWAGTTGYVNGDVRKNGSNVYRCETPGTSAGSGGPTGTGDAISDGSVTWNFVGAGAAYVDVICHSSNNGPQQALAGTLNVIVTPVAGWSACRNNLDATLGTALETDTDLRLRRIAELAANGSANVDAIRSALVRLKDSIGAAVLSSASVFENPSDAVDAFGLPPHSVQAVVDYIGSPITATDLAIATQLFSSKAAGIQTFGAVPIVVTDSQGVTHTVNFDRPTIVNVWVKVVGTKDATYGGDTAVKLALVEYAQGLLPPFPGYAVGGDVYTGHLYAPITDNVSGIVDISSILVSSDGVTYTAGPLVISRVQLAAFDTSRITVTFT